MCKSLEDTTASILVRRFGSIDGSVVTGRPLLLLDLGSIIGALLPILSPDITNAVSISVFATLSVGGWSQSLEKASATTLSSPLICMYSKLNSCNASCQRRTLADWAVLKNVRFLWSVSTTNRTCLSKKSNFVTV